MKLSERSYRHFMYNTDGLATIPLSSTLINGSWNHLCAFPSYVDNKQPTDFYIRVHVFWVNNNEHFGKATYDSLGLPKSI